MSTGEIGDRVPPAGRTTGPPRRRRDRVYRICYRSAGNAEDTEDWAQECLLRVYPQLRELAEVLGVPLQTAATRVRRALAEVRQRLARSEMEAGP